LEITKAACSTAVIAAVLNVRFGSKATKPSQAKIELCPLLL
jgi:hypothetical protein